MRAFCVPALRCAKIKTGVSLKNLGLEIGERMKETSDAVAGGDPPKHLFCVDFDRRTHEVQRWLGAGMVPSEHDSSYMRQVSAGTSGVGSYRRGLVALWRGQVTEDSSRPESPGHTTFGRLWRKAAHAASEDLERPPEFLGADAAEADVLPGVLPARSVLEATLDVARTVIGSHLTICWTQDHEAREGDICDLCDIYPDCTEALKLAVAGEGKADIERGSWK